MIMNVSKIVTLALKQLGVLAAGENPTAQELADATDCLRGMLGQWATEQLFVYKTLPITLNLSGAGTYTLSQTIQSISEIGVLDDVEINLINDKNNTGVAEKVIYTKDSPFWKFQVLSNSKKLELKCYVLPTTLEMHDEVELPVEYERALILSLAIEIAPLFAVEPSMSLVRNQQGAVNLLKHSNSTPMYTQNDMPIGVCRGDIYGDYY